jgi:hypothetical protein
MPDNGEDVIAAALLDLSVDDEEASPGKLKQPWG